MSTQDQFGRVFSLGRSMLDKTRIGDLTGACRRSVEQLYIYHITKGISLQQGEDVDASQAYSYARQMAGARLSDIASLLGARVAYIEGTISEVEFKARAEAYALPVCTPDEAEIDPYLKPAMQDLVRRVHELSYRALKLDESLAQIEPGRKAG